MLQDETYWAPLLFQGPGKLKKGGRQTGEKSEKLPGDNRPLTNGEKMKALLLINSTDGGYRVGTTTRDFSL